MRLFESPQIVSRFNKILEPLNLRRDHYRSVVAILVLTLLNYRPTLDILIALCGDGVLESSFKRDAAIQELVDFHQSIVRIRSSIAAQAILLKIADPNITVDVLIEIVRAAEKASVVSTFYSSITKDLMRFTNLQRLLPERHRRAATIRYYEATKNLEIAQRNPLFWLQYAIACTVLEDFERAGQYFDTAYSFAEVRGPNYDTYQIDNHYARFVLLSAVHDGDSTTAMARFREAREIINQQIKRERRHFPYRVAATYADFYDTFEPKLTADHKEEITRAAKFVADRIKQLPEMRQRQRYVIECSQKMAYVMNKSEKQESKTVRVGS
jgi:tetratricopeptide (TPR) repeat protein